MHTAYPHPQTNDIAPSAYPNTLEAKLRLEGPRLYFFLTFSGSHAMFSEAIHSAADTLNQLILVYGIRKSVTKPGRT